MKHKFILIWREDLYPPNISSTYQGRGFNDAELLLEHDACGFPDSFVIVNGVVYDTKDLDQAIADSE